MLVECIRVWLLNFQGSNKNVGSTNLQLPTLQRGQSGEYTREQTRERVVLESSYKSVENPLETRPLQKGITK